MEKPKLFIVVFLIFVSFVAFHAHMAHSSAETPTRVSIDQAEGAFRFVIDGRVVAEIAANGLTVKGDIEYGGTLTDSGQDDLDQKLNPQSEGGDER